ncbi:hypothetical protein QQX09_04870 [Demequina sp. SYSU T00192]|uniref:Lipoprotein n=1 Tax=Demequina litoralis TaxID=3051660 RepID=A0ABT8G7S7_9MICO|nr:hypothetical protein [Demequina sp. SYSU T00192]MDN4475190.1 hypothetical protein [Demequina sp. SYSU T00192]
MHATSALRAAAATALVAPLLAACAGTPDYPVVATAAAAEVPDASLAMRSVEVTIGSTGDEDVVLTGGTVFTPYFDRLDAVGLHVTVPAGGEVTIRLPLGLATCPAGEGESSAQLVLEAGGEELLQTVLLRDRQLARLNEATCALRLDDEDL